MHVVECGDLPDCPSNAELADTILACVKQPNFLEEAVAEDVTPESLISGSDTYDPLNYFARDLRGFMETETQKIADKIRNGERNLVCGGLVAKAYVGSTICSVVCGKTSEADALRFKKRKEQ